MPLEVARGHPTSTTSSVLQPHFCDVGLTWPHSIGALLHPSFYLICSPSADPQGGALVLLSSSAPCGPTLLPIAAECPLMSLLAGQGGVPVAPSPLHTAPLPSPEHGVWSPADRHGLAAVPHPRPSPGWVDRHKDVSAIPDIAHPVSRAQFLGLPRWWARDGSGVGGGLFHHPPLPPPYSHSSPLPW